MILMVLSFGTNLTDLKVVSPISSSLFVPGGIASFVGILDEIHQAYIPGRDSSITDVMLDITGITLTAIKIEELQVEQTLKRLKGIEMITQPNISSKPVKPKKRQNVMIAGVVGLLASIMLAFFMEFLEKNKGVFRKPA